MSESELREHAGYLADSTKLDAYERALRAVLHGRDAAVLDLGAGSGILGLLAARAGARRVYAVDSGSVIGPASEVASLSPYADRFVHIKRHSSEVELPEKIDVAVCDQMGGFVHAAGVLGLFADVRQRLLASDGVLVPSGFRMFLAPVRCGRVRDLINVWGSKPAGFDFGVFRESAVNTEHRVDVEQLQVLGPGVQIAEISSDHVDPIKGQGRVTITEDGRCDGLVGWFEADMGGGVVLTNDPTDRSRIDRWCAMYPITEGVQVERGDTMRFQIDVRPLLHAVTWGVEITSLNGTQRAKERHSTLLGEFLAADDLARDSGKPIVATKLGRAFGRALELADGSRSTDAVLDQLAQEIAEDGRLPAFEGTVRGQEFTLRELLQQFTQPVAGAG